MAFLDTSFLVAYYNAHDAHHAAARDAMARLAEEGSHSLLDYVLAETLTVTGARAGMAAARQAADDLTTAEEFALAPGTGHLGKGLKRFLLQPKLGLSFVDAVLVEAALASADPRVATFDRDFRKVDGIEVVP